MKESRIKKITKRIVTLKKISFLNLGAEECRSSKSGLDLICIIRKHDFIYNQFKKTINRCLKNEVVPILRGHISEDKINLMKRLTEPENAGLTFGSLCYSRHIDKSGEILDELTSKGLDLEIMEGFNTCLDIFFSKFGWVLDDSCLSASKLSIEDIHCIITYMDSEYKKISSNSGKDTEKSLKEKDSRIEEIRDISNMFFV